MVNGEPIVSQASTPEFREAHERIFGDKPIQRGRWVWDAERQELVPADHYIAPSHAKDAPIMAGRFYENTSATDGTDVSTRQKHRDYMRRNGLTTTDDYKQSWAQAQAKRDAVREQYKMPSASRREALARAMYRMDKP
jgi:hypothetical protein